MSTRKKGVLIEDGVVCHHQWEQAEPKVLWLLRDPHAEDPDKSWSLTWLLHRCAERGFKEKQAATYALVAKTTWALMAWPPAEEIPVPTKFKAHNCHRWLSSIAVLNVDPTAGGGSSTDHENLSKQARDPEVANKLVRRIKDLRPDLVIGGNTLHLFHHEFIPALRPVTIASLKGKHGFPTDKKDGVVWVNALHPGVHSKGMNHSLYVERVREAWHAYREKSPV